MTSTEGGARDGSVEGTTLPPLPVAADELDLTAEAGLDFVNTVIASGSGPVDLLVDPETFLDWIAHLDAARRPHGHQRLAELVPRDLPSRTLLHREARALRTALAELFRLTARGEPPPPSVAFAVDRALGAARVSYAFGMLEGRPGHVARFEPRGVTAVLAPLALSAVRLAASADPRRFRECDADDCTRWFVDTSKGGRRRWCSMARCGNRAKAARYRRRHAGI